MTDSDSLRGDIDRPHTNLPQCCGELEILRALLRPRMAEVGDPTPTEALRGMFIEIERLRVTTSEGARCQVLEERLTAVKHTLQALRGRLHELLQLSMDGTSDRDIFARISTMIDREGRRRPMDEAILADNESAIARLADELAAERKMARAAADGHDHARALLVASAEVFGRVDDLDSLPAKVRELSDNCLHNCTKAERLQDRVDEQDKARVLRAAETASERNHLEGELTRAKAEIKSLTHATFTIHQLTTAIGNAAKEVGVLCEGRSAVDILPDLLGLMKARIERAPAFIARYADERVQAHIEHAKGRVAEAEAALALLGWDRAQDMTTWARSSAQPVAAARWSAICEAFGFDPEEDPPASIPAILAGDRWTNTRRMLADACANLRAPSLEMVLGELIQTLSKARGVATGRDETRRAALVHLGWDGEGDPEAWALAMAAERSKLMATLITGHDEARKFRFDVEEALRNAGVVDYERDIVSRIGAAFKQAGALLERCEVMEAQLKAADLDTSEIEAVREALGVPADKPLLPYVHHAAKGMQALAVLGWQDGHPVEWATKRAAAEADLRGAFAEAQLVGNDHAAMVRQLWGNLRGKSAQHVDAIARLHALADSVRELDGRLLQTTHECAGLRTALAERNARIHQLEIDNSKVHLEGRIELAEKRVAFFRAWLLGMNTSKDLIDEALIRMSQFVPRGDYDGLQRINDSLTKECDRLRSLQSFMVDIKRRLIALPDLSP